MKKGTAGYNKRHSKWAPLLLVDTCCNLSLTVGYFPTQFQTAVEYQRFADRWFKCCIHVPLDPVSALNLWWNSGSSFGFGLNDAIPVAFSCFRCIQSPCFASFVWSPFADLVVSKDSDICWIFDGWVKDFCGCTFWIQHSVQGGILEKVWWLLVFILEEV